VTARVDAPPTQSLQSLEAQRGTAPLLSAVGLALLLGGAFLPMVDFFIVNVALPTIDSTLHGSAPMLELVVAGYGTAYALLLVVGGRLGDAYGRRRVFRIGLVGFTITSLLCGLTPSIGLLVAARVAQGISSAMIVPQVLATFQSTLEGRARHRALGLYGATAGIAGAVGQLIGGLLVTADIAGSTWRPIFLVNVPIGLVLMFVAGRYVPETRSANPASVDLLGTALFGLTMVTLLVPLTEGDSLGWPAWTWVLLAVSPIAAAATVYVERRSERNGGSPLLPPSLLGLRSMRRGTLLALPFFVGFGAFMFVFSLTVQGGLHQSALDSGLAITPLAVLFLVASLITPRLLARYGRRAVMGGAVLQGTGLLALIAVVAGNWPNVSLWAMAPGLAVAGFGQAIVFGSMFRLVLADVPARLAGIGGGVLLTLQQSGVALGVATLGTLFSAISRHDPATAFGVVIGVQAAIAVLIAVGSVGLPSLVSNSDAEPVPVEV